MNSHDLTAARLQELLDYSPETGVFTWRRRATGNNKFAGKSAGTVTRAGYSQIRIDRHGYRASRLAWLYVYGRWPTQLVDHENRVRADNRISNLREATDAQNAQNKTCRAKSGFLGVALHKSRWKAMITSGGQTIYLGIFGTPDLAHAAYVAAKRKLHPFGTL